MMTAGILFLDDDAVQMMLYKSIAKKHFSASDINYASTVADAEEILYGKEIKVAVFDLMIPTQNGADLIVKMKGDSRFDKTIILIVSAADKDSLLFDSLRAHANEFITKPVNHESFVKTIKKYLES